MVALTDVVRRVTIQATGADGVDKVAGSMNNLAAAEGKVSVASDNVSRATISMQVKLDSLQRSLDVNYRNQTALQKATDALARSRSQGLIDAGREAELLELARGKYTALTPAVEELTRGYSLNRSQVMELTHSARSLFDMIAAGQSPMRAFEMEGARLAQVMGEGQGGFGGALAALAPLLLPIGIILGGITLGFAGLTSEIDRTTGKNITFMEVIKGTFQAAWDGVTHLFGPAVQKAGSMFGDFIAYIAPAAKGAFNFFVATWDLAFRDVSTLMGRLPAVLGDLTVQAANGALKGIEWLINGAIDKLDSFIQLAKDHLGPLGNGLSLVGHVDLGGGIANPWAGATGAMTGDLQKNAAAVKQNDYGAMAFSNITKFALQDYNADQLAKGGKAAEALAKSFDKLLASGQNDVAALTAQAAALGQSTEQAAFLEEQTKLLNKANSDGIKLTPAMLDQVNATASAYAKEKSALEQLTAVYDAGKSAVESLFSGFESNLKNGEGWFQAFADAGISALQGILDKALQVAADNVWNQLWNSGSSGGGLGGIISGLLGVASGTGGLGPLYATGGYTGAGGMFEPAGIVHKGEYVIDAASTARIGVANLDRLRGYAGGGYVQPASSSGPSRLHVTVGVDTDSQGNITPYVTSVVMDGIEQYNQRLPKRLREIQKDPRAA